MKITIECNPCDIAELSKVLNTGTTDSISKENADSAVEEQNRQETTGAKKVQEIVNKQIDLLIEASKHVAWDKLPSVTLALETLLQNHQFD